MGNSLTQFVKAAGYLPTSAADILRLQPLLLEGTLPLLLPQTVEGVTEHTQQYPPDL
jgi:hypothetical protein